MAESKITILQYTLNLDKEIETLKISLKIKGKI